MNIRAHAQKFIEKLMRMQRIEQLPDDHETILNILQNKVTKTRKCSDLASEIMMAHGYSIVPKQPIFMIEKVER